MKLFGKIIVFVCCLVVMVVVDVIFPYIVENFGFLIFFLFFLFSFLLSPLSLPFLSPPRDKVLKSTIARFFGAMFIMLTVFMIVLALYFGAMWDPQTKNLEIRIINKDDGINFGGGLLNIGGEMGKGRERKRNEEK